MKVGKEMKETSDTKITSTRQIKLALEILKLKKRKNVDKNRGTLAVALKKLTICPSFLRE